MAAFAFFGFFWIWRGRTLGMQAWRLRVQTHRGHNITAEQAVKRFISAIPSLGLAGAGFLWILVDPARLSWTDRASGTYVVTVPDEWMTLRPAPEDPPSP